MSMWRRGNPTGLIALFVVAILVSFWLGSRLINPATSASSLNTAPMADSQLSMSSSTIPHSPASTASPAPAATPTPTPTATPVPDNYIWIPWRSQFDGTAYASANCGPACLGMAMSYFGEWWSTSGIRTSTNARSGLAGLDDGTDWPSLEYAAEKRGFTVVGLYDSNGAYRQWTIDDLVNETEQGHPVILLVHQRSLPGHENSRYYGDHYIVFLGLMADGRVVYHDPAFNAEIDGSYRIASKETLLEAWGNTSVGLRYTAISLMWEHEGRKWDEKAATEPIPSADN